MFAPPSRRGLKAVVLAALLAVSPVSPAHAWGDKGHRIVGHLARELLSPPARSALAQLMDGDDLATFGLHLDVHRDRLDMEIAGSRKWHYDNIPVCRGITPLHHCLDGHCATVQIARHLGKLADRAEPSSGRRFALYVVAHLVADIHQPLHAADNDDRGGNDVHVRLPDGRDLNLHAAWDTAFGDRAFGDQDEVAVARELRQKYRARMTAWQTGDAATWALESNRIARAVVYGKLPGFSCDAPRAAARIRLPASYVREAGRVVEEQLAKAGYRLAHVLNSSLGD